MYYFHDEKEAVSSQTDSHTDFVLFKNHHT